MTTATEELFDRPQGMRSPTPLLVLSLVAAAMMCTSVWMAFFYAPEEKVMGFVQRIFYFHVASAWTMFLATGIMAVASIGYLINKKDGWDQLSEGAVELAITFGLMVVISGPLWGRKAWGAYWVWDVRLTSTLILVLTLVACKIVRAYAGPSAKQISAALAVFAVLDSVFVYVSVKFWTTTHPPQVTGNLDPQMKQTMWFCVLSYAVTFSALLWARLRLGRLKIGIDRLHMQATEAGLHD